MIEEMLSSVKSQIKERLGSPLMGAFILSWTIVNYRFIAVLWADMPVAERFEMIDTILYPDFSTRMWLLVGYPIIATITFIVVYPHLARWVFNYWRRQQNKLRELRQKIDGEAPVTKEESTRMWARFFEQEKKYEEQLSERDREIIELKNELKLAISETQAVKSSSVEVTVQNHYPGEMQGFSLTAGTILILMHEAEEAHQEITRDMLEKVLSKKHGVTPTRYELEKLEKNYLIRQYNDVFTLTEKGRKAIIDYLVAKKATDLADKELAMQLTKGKT